MEQESFINSQRNSLTSRSFNPTSSSSYHFNRQISDPSFGSTRSRLNTEDKISKTLGRSLIMTSVLMCRVSAIVLIWLFFLYSEAFAKSYDRILFEVGNAAREVVDCIPDMKFDQIAETSTTQYKIHDRHFSKVELPSLNLFDYDDRLDFPIFPDNDFPNGLKRKDMPQFEFNRSTKLWDNFVENIQNAGGSMRLQKEFDLRLARPLQSELSGYIVYNVLFENFRSRFSASVALEEVVKIMRNYFTSKIVIVKSPSSLASSKGNLIDKESYFILDGHHTTYVASKLCSSPHSLLRLGNYFKNIEGSCGKLFDPKQDIFVIEGIELIRVREIALESGAATGHDVMLPSAP